MYKIDMIEKIVNGKKGFTLIELIIVVGIVSVLSISVLTVLNPFAQFEKSADARRKSDLSQIQKALENYYSDNNRYPPNGAGCAYEIAGNNGNGNNCIEWGSSWQPYMNLVPADPDPARKYVYFVSSDGQAYWLYANLSRGAKDPQICQNLVGGECKSISDNSITANSCGASNNYACNFGVSSPNKSP